MHRCGGNESGKLEGGWERMTNGRSSRSLRSIAISSRSLGACLHRLLLILSAVFLTLSSVHAITSPSDKLALLAMKNDVDDYAGILSGWDEYTDPCIDQWRGVSCTCYPFFEDASVQNRNAACTPIASEYTANYSRVLQLNLGDVRITDWNTIEGDLPASVGNLTALRVLNFKGNRFSGSIPDSWSKLQGLELLSLSFNNITGAIPAFLADLSRLKYVYLDNNNFFGELPYEWCEGTWWVFDVRNNPKLCGELPDCLFERITTLEGTSLVDPVSDLNDGNGGYCDVLPPFCREGKGQCTVRVPSPPFWNNETKVEFSFPELPSYEGGLPTTYYWALGTEPESNNIIKWMQINSSNSFTFTEEIEIDMNVYDYLDYGNGRYDYYGGFEEENSAEPSEMSRIAQKMINYNGWIPSGISLRHGSMYYVTIKAINSGGETSSVLLSSPGVMLDSTPPTLPTGKAIYNTRLFSNSPAQLDASGIGVSWDPFEDPESGIDSYLYQVFQQHVKEGEEDVAVTDQIKIAELDQRAHYISGLNLRPGYSYFIRVYAENMAGKGDFEDSPPVLIVDPSQGIVVENRIDGLDPSTVAIIIAVVVGTCSATVAFLTFYLARERYRRRQKVGRRLKGEMRNLRYLLTSLSNDTKYKGTGDPFYQLRNLKDIAFVVTDLENSTVIASAAPRVYDWVQEAHDNLIRDAISAHRGYEINTEGDAFHIAFTSIGAAVCFCMEVQYQMLDVEWPRQVLRLPECKEIKGQDGGLNLRGPRVRMAIHFAVEGSVLSHVHTLTKHRIFTGPAFQVTRNLCEIAKGGQVLMTHQAWNKLNHQMALASFPVVEQLGLYKLQSWTEPILIYQITRLLGRSMHRASFGAGFDAENLAGAVKIQDGAGLRIVPPPPPQSQKGNLTFVVCRLALESCSVSHRQKKKSCSQIDVPPGLHKRLLEILASSAMQFQGYLYRFSGTQGQYFIVFESTLNAVRFSHASQALFLFSHWPLEFSEWYGTEKLGADGKPLFRGPRIAMAIHESNDYSTRPIASGNKLILGSKTKLIDYVGPAEEICRTLSLVSHGGQVILSENAWAAVQDGLPGHPCIISLGTLAFEDPYISQPMMIMEVMPQPLAKRKFPAPQRATRIEPSYHDAPSGNEELAIVHFRVDKPSVVQSAEKTSSGLSDEEIVSVITSYNLAIAQAVKVARHLLKTHNGYECKEPESGKLTIAFHTLSAAITWAAAVQVELLHTKWPVEILKWDECKEIRDNDEEEYNDIMSTGTTFLSIENDNTITATAGSPNNFDATILWRGLAARIGIAAGNGAYKAPLNTGRADFYGMVPNLAARLVSLAHPGQILVDAAMIRSIRGIKWRDDTIYLGGTKSFPEDIVISPLGQVAIKGFEELRNVYQCLPASLQARSFAENQAIVRPISMTKRMLSSIKRSGNIIQSSNDVWGVEGNVLDSKLAECPRTEKQGTDTIVPKIFASISRSGSVSPANIVDRKSNLMRFSVLSRSFSKNSDVFDGTTNNAMAANSIFPYRSPGSAVYAQYSMIPSQTRSSITSSFDEKDITATNSHQSCILDETGQELLSSNMHFKGSENLASSQHYSYDDGDNINGSLKTPFNTLINAQNNTEFLFEMGNSSPSSASQSLSLNSQGADVDGLLTRSEPIAMPSRIHTDSNTTEAEKIKENRTKLLRSSSTPVELWDKTNRNETLREMKHNDLKVQYEVSSWKNEVHLGVSPGKKVIPETSIYKSGVGISGGVNVARQLAQLFVERRRRQASSSGAKQPGSNVEDRIGDSSSSRNSTTD